MAGDRGAAPRTGGPAAGDGALAQVYRRFAETAAAASPLYERIAVALSGSAEALRVVGAAPARARQPALVLAALHDLALAGRAPALAAAYATGDADAAGGAAVEALLRLADPVLALVGRRQVRTTGTDHLAVLYPAVAEAAHRVGASAVGLVSVGGSTGLDVQVDRVGITYGNGQRLGDPSSPVQLTCAVAGHRSLPTRAVPEVVARVVVDRDPVDVSDPEEVRWLRACLRPDQPEQRSRLDAELALAASGPPLLLRGDPVELLSEALAQVPADALPVVTTTWALSPLPLESRLRFLQGLDTAATGRPVAWVPVEGVGVAPAIPTLGDRRASGHSIVGLAVVEPSALRTEAVGRCWSRGRTLAWLGDS